MKRTINFSYCQKYLFRHILYCLSTIAFCLLFSLNCLAQLGVTYDLKKPEKYEDRPLGYEKTDQKKFKIPRHFIQNTVTHYNYYFNGNNKLNEILAKAKAQNRDDYTQLLPFYNYSLDITALAKRDLDSVIDKVNTAVLVHDLRNDWVDNMYMLMGRAYYYKKDFDSAYTIFQFVNYAFGPKEEDGYFKMIGSNANAEEGGNANIVSTNEKRNIVKRALSLPPSRNESFIWQTRNYIAKDEMSKAAALIDILKRDPQFPQRLQPDLQEMQALWFYKKNMYDSAAAHLEKALGRADGRLEQARWEYLIAQLYERANKPDMAKIFYERCIQHTYDPVMDVYARLNAIRQNRGTGGGDDYIQKNIEALEKMARKETYAAYRDVIYYAAAEMELERHDKPAAIKLLIKSTKSATAMSVQRDKAFLLLASLCIQEKQYRYAKNYYDSINVSDPSIADSLKTIQDRKKALATIVDQMNIIEKQDSLQRIAMMPENERDAYLKKLLRALRRQHGLSEDDQSNNGSPSFNSSNAQTDLFSSSGNSSGEWYFYNPSVKAKGFSEFKSKWGNRPNVDNWMVASMDAKQQKINTNGNNPMIQDRALDNGINPQQQQTVELTAAALLANLPLTPEKMQKSKDTVQFALLAMGKAFKDYVPDYNSAINTYDTILEKFPATGFYEEILFNLYYCYKKLGDDGNAARILQLLKQKNPGSKYVAMITNPEASPDKIIKDNATKQYEKIYSDFIEGDFEQALAEKKQADSLYGDKYWTPQLLYIEAVYFVHIRDDSKAIAELNNIQKKYAGTPIAAKAKNMEDVLMRRKQIEEYLTNLKVERATDSTGAVANANNKTISSTPAKADSSKTKTDSTKIVVNKNKPKTDTALSVKKAPAAFASAFTNTPERSHAVMIVMNKVDPVYVAETRNAFNRYNRENYYGKIFDISNIALNDSIKLVVITGGFDSASAALDYMMKAQKIAPREILPWLPAAKYSFMIITDLNLATLKENKDLAAYKKFLSVYYPANFSP